MPPRFLQSGSLLAPQEEMSPEEKAAVLEAAKREMSPWTTGLRQGLESALTRGVGLYASATGQPTLESRAAEIAAPSLMGAAGSVAGAGMAPSLLRGARGTGEAPRPPAELEFAGSMAGVAGQALGGGFGVPSVVPGASVRPITEARKRLEAIPGQIQATTQQGIKALRKAGGEVGRAELGYAQALGETQRAKAGVLRAGLAAVEDVRRERDAYVQQAQQRVDNTMMAYQQAKVKHAAMTIDPDRKFRGGAKIASAVAMALGAFGQALTGGQNTALTIIQNEIDRDIQAQQLEMAKAGREAEMAGTEVGMARQLFDDAMSQRIAAENFHWQNVGRQIELTAAEHADQETQTNAQRALAGVNLKLAEGEQRLLDRQQGLEMQAAGQGLQAAVAEVGARQRGQEFKAGQQARLQAALVKGLAQSSAPPTLALVDPSYKPTKTDTQKAQKMSSAYGMVMQELDKLIAWRLQYGAEIVDRGALKVGNTILNRLKSKMRKLDETGARIDPGEIEMMGLMEDAGELGWVKEQLATLRESIVGGTLAGMEPYGYTLRAQRVKQRGRKISK